MSDISIDFINHSCILIKTPEGDVLCDPWFDGDVFNGSWSLLQKTELENLDLSNLKFIWVSHEHPDHLHFPTLKKIRDFLPRQEVTFLYRLQSNKNVIESVQRLGFKTLELKAGEFRSLTRDLRVYTEDFRMDSALVVDFKGQVILNQNDCALDGESVQKIKNRFPKIHWHLFQFSLSGYYANPEDNRRLLKAKEFHIRMAKHYQQAFSAEVFVPFASFIYFCRSGNEYLNRFRVSTGDLVEAIGLSGSTFIPCYNENIPPAPDETISKINQEKWRKISEFQNLKIQKENAVSEPEINSVIEKFLGEYRSSFLKILLPGSTKVFLRGVGKVVEINMRKLKFEILNGSEHRADVVLADEDFLYALKFPWGADTLNITGNLRVHNQFKWRHFLYTMHARYALHGKSPLTLAVAPSVAAILRTIQFYLRIDRF